MKITINNLDTFDFTQFHDYEVSKIECDYSKHFVHLPMLTPQCTDASTAVHLLFYDTTHLTVEINEPWGEGIYISDVEAFRDQHNCAQSQVSNAITVSIQLNSGDKICIQCKAFEILRDAENTELDSRK